MTMNRELLPNETTRKLTDQEKQDIAIQLETMDNIHVTILQELRDDRACFMLESHSSHLPVQRVAGKLKRRGCEIKNTGRSRVKVIVLPAFIVGEKFR